jgi:di/tricarboxylate transporter
MTYLSRSISQALKDDAIFSDLSEEELAKLAGAGELCHFQAQSTVYKFGDNASCLYVIISGSIRLSNEFDEELTHENGVFGEEVVTLDCYITSAIAVSDLVLLQLNKQTLLDLQLQKPKLAINTGALTLSRHMSTRTSKKEAVQKKLTATLSNKEKLGWFFSAVLPIAFFFIAQSSGFSSYASLFIAIISAVILMWSFTIVDEFIPPIVAMVACILTGLAPPNVALAGFATPALLILLGIYALTGAITQSGLSYRLVLNLIKILPRTAYTNQFVLMFSGFLLSFVTPSGNNRISLLLPVFRDMVTGLKLGKESSHATALMAATFGSAMIFSPMLAVSKSANITAVSLLPESLQQQFLGFYWLYCALFFIIGIVAVHFISVRIIFSNPSRVTINEAILTSQLECLGPMRPAEKLVASIFFSYILFCITYSIHQINISVISGVLLISLLLFGAYSKIDFKNLTDWPMIFFLLGVDSLMNIMGYLGLDQSLARSVQFLYQFIDGRLWLFLLAACATTLIIRLALPLTAGMLTSFAILLPVALSQHIHPWICLFVCAVFSDIWFLRYQSSVYLQARSTISLSMYSEPKFLIYNWYLNIGRVLIVFASIPWWIYLGLV